MEYYISNDGIDYKKVALVPKPDFAKGDLIYRIDSKKSVLEMIAAHNAMLTQMNSITSNTLDLKTLLEEGENL